MSRVLGPDRSVLTWSADGSQVQLAQVRPDQDPAAMSHSVYPETRPDSPALEDVEDELEDVEAEEARRVRKARFWVRRTVRSAVRGAALGSLGFDPICARFTVEALLIESGMPPQEALVPVQLDVVQRDSARWSDE